MSEVHSNSPEFLAWSKAMAFDQSDSWNKISVTKIKYAMVIPIDDASHIDIVTALFSTGCKVSVDRNILSNEIYVTGIKRCWPWEAPPYLIGFGPLPKANVVHDSYTVLGIRSDALLQLIQGCNIKDDSDNDDFVIANAIGIPECSRTGQCTFPSCKCVSASRAEKD